MRGMGTTKRQVAIQRTLAVLWAAMFIGALSYWLWGFLHKMAPAYDGIHALQSPILLFGIVASVSYSRVQTGHAFLWGVSRSFSQSERFLVKLCRKIGECGGISWGTMRGFVLSQVTIVLLFFPRREPIAKQIAPQSD